jgi:DnaJ-class molecular chaperone
MARDDEQGVFLVLDKQCTECWGNGEYDGVTCGVCEGRGRVLTSAGESVIDFIQRWLTVKPKSGELKDKETILVRKDKVDG